MRPPFFHGWAILRIMLRISSLTVISFDRKKRSTRLTLLLITVLTLTCYADGERCSQLALDPSQHDVCNLRVGITLHFSHHVCLTLIANFLLIIPSLLLWPVSIPLLTLWHPLIQFSNFAFRIFRQYQVSPYRKLSTLRHS